MRKLLPKTILLAITFLLTCCAVNSAYSQPINISLPHGNPVLRCESSSLDLSTLISVTGGSQTYLYEWSGPGGFTSTLNNPVLNPLNSTNAGPYFVTITDYDLPNTFASIMFMLNVVQNNVPVPVISPGGPILQCPRPMDTLTCTPANGNGYTYHWSIGTSTTASCPVPVAGNYVVTITNQGGCWAKSDTVKVTFLPGPIAGLIDTAEYFFNEKAFTFCGGGDYHLGVMNSSLAWPSTTYEIQWGIGNDPWGPSPNFPSTSPYPSYFYPHGVFPLTFIALDTISGCSDTLRKTVTTLNSPHITVPNPGDLTQCVPNEICFHIQDLAMYYPWAHIDIDFGDFTKITIPKLLSNDTVICYEYTKPSCPNFGPDNTGFYNVNVVADNNCPSTGHQTFGKIFILEKPKADFQFISDSCGGSQIKKIKNTTIPGYGVFNDSCKQKTTYWWKDNGVLVAGPLTCIGPVSSPCGDLDMAFSAGTHNICLIAVTAYNTGSNECKSDTFCSTLCIRPKVKTKFTVTHSSPLHCFPDTLKLLDQTDYSPCSADKLEWNITYAAPLATVCPPYPGPDTVFVNGTNKTSPLAYVVLKKPGTYTIRLHSANSCNSDSTITVNIKGPPRVTLSPIMPLVSCLDSVEIKPLTISSGKPRVSFWDCDDGIDTYRWDTIWGGNGFWSNGDTAGLPPAAWCSHFGTNYVIASVSNECGSDQDTISFNLSPEPKVDSIPNQVLCPNETTLPIVFSGPISGTTFGWTNTNTSIGLAASGSGNIPAFMVTNATNNIKVATITVTPSANGCSGTPRTFTITVNPKPSVNNLGTLASRCNGDLQPAINFSGPVTGTSFSWENSDPTIGIGASGTGNIGPFNVINTGSASVTATITVTPHFTNAGRTCDGTPKTVTLTVNPTPVLDTIISQTVCAGTMTTAVNFNASFPGTTFSWTNNTPGIGLGASNTGHIASFMAVNTGTTALTATITVTPYYNGCAGTSRTFTITVNPKPTVTNVDNYNFCNAVQTTTISLTGSVTGSYFVWTNSQTSIGLAATDTGDIAMFTPINNDLTPVVANLSVIPYANGCQGSAKAFTITVNPTPGAVSVADTALCAGTLYPGKTLNGLFSVTTFSWTITQVGGPSVSGFQASGSGNIPAFTPMLICNNASATLAIHVTPTANNCIGPTMTYYLTIHCQPNVNVSCGPTLTAPAFPTLTATTTPSVTAHYWSPGGGNTNPFVISNAINTNTTYCDSVVEPLHNCGAKSCCTVTVNNPFVLDSLTAVPDAVCSGNNVLLTAYYHGGTPPYTTQWTSVAPSPAFSSTANPATAAILNNSNSVLIYTYSVSLHDNTSTVQSGSVSILVYPAPIVNPIAGQTVSNGATTAEVNFGGTVAGTSYSWTNNTTSIGLGLNGIGNIPSFTAINNGNSPVTALITVTPNANNCPGSPQTFNITVNPTPTANVPTSQTVCNGFSTTTVTFSGTVAGTTYAWTNNNTSIGLGASGSGNIPSFTALNTGNSPVVATITVIPTANGNPGPPITFTITVNPTPTVDNVTSITVCNGASTPAINFNGNVSGTTFSWTNSNNTIGLGNYGNGNIALFTAINTGNVPVVATITVTPHYSNNNINCNGGPKTFTITVNPSPGVNTIPGQVVCNGGNTTLVSFNGPVAGSIYTWATDNSGIGTLATGTGNIPSFQAINTDITAAIANITVTPHFTNNTVTCDGTIKAFIITVNPSPTVNSVSNQERCNGNPSNAVSFSGSITGTTFSWVNNTPSIGLLGSGTGNIAAFTALNATTAIVTATITITPHYFNANLSCDGPSGSYTYTVFPTPSVNNIANQAVCNGTSSTTVSFLGPVNGTTYTWANNTSGLGLAPSGNGNLLPFSATNSGNTAIQTIVTVTPQANGCTGPVKTFSFTVNPTPLATPVNPQQVCNGNPTTAINFVANVTGSSFTWSNNTAGIGLAGNGSGNIGVFNAVNLSNSPVIATITAIPQYTNAGITCDGSSISTNITVNPTPVVNTVLNQAPCNGALTTAITFGGTVSGATYTWVNNSPGIGLAASGTGNIPAFTAINTNPAPLIATITVTPHANGCDGLPKTFTITAMPSPVVTAFSNMDVCNGDVVSPLPFASTTSGTTYSWTNNLPGIGLAASGNGNLPTFTAINTGLVPIIATISVIGHANYCDGPVLSFTITVNPAPVVNGILNRVYCHGMTAPAVEFNGPVTGTSYTWTNNQPSIGLPASGTGTIAAFTVLNSTNAPITATIKVWPHAGSCTGLYKSFTITINPKPIISNVTEDTIICQGTVFGPLCFNVIPASASSSDTFNIYYPTIGFPPPPSTGSGCIPAFIAASNETTPRTATITVFPQAYGCIGDSTQFQVTVEPSPKLSPVAHQKFCANDSCNILFSPAITGQIVNWTNNNTSIGLASSGTGDIHFVTSTPLVTQNATITVTAHTPNCMLDTTIQFLLTVYPVPMAYCGPDDTICAGDPVNFVEATAQGENTISWLSLGSGTFLPNNVLNPTYIPGNNDITVGSVILVMRVNGNYTCGNANDTIRIKIYPRTTANAGLDDSICYPMTYALNPSVQHANRYKWDVVPANAGIFSPSDTVLAATFTPSLSAAGNLVELCLSVEDTSLAYPACSRDTSCMTLKIRQLLMPQMIQDTSICPGDQVQLYAAYLPGHSYTWTGEAMSSFRVPDPQAWPTLTGMYYLTVTYLGCSNSDSVKVSLKIPPQALISPSPDTNICIGDCVLLQASGGTSYTWNTAANTASLHPCLQATTRYTVTVTDNTTSCSDTASSLVIVHGKPALEILPTEASICIDSAIQLCASGASLYEWLPDSTITGFNTDNSCIDVRPYFTDSYSVIGSNQWNCKDTLSKVVKVFPPPVTLLPDVAYLCSGLPLSLQAGRGHDLTYAWSGNLPPDSVVQIYDIYPFTEKVFTCTISNEGCSIQTSVLVRLGTTLWLPNSFTPINRDGLNDLFGPVVSERLDDFQMMIYTRWGEVIFESHSQDKHWDGTYHGELCPVGVYDYVIFYKAGYICTPVNNTTHTLRGTVMIVN